MEVRLSKDILSPTVIRRKRFSLSDKMAIIGFAFTISTSTALLIINIISDHRSQIKFSVLGVLALLVSAYMYFIQKKKFASSLLVVITMNLVYSLSSWNIGLTSSNILYALTCIAAIPTICKVQKKFVKNSIILLSITCLFAVLTLIISPQYNPSIMATVDVNKKLLINTLIAFFLMLVFVSLIVVFSVKTVINLVRAKRNAEKQKDIKTRVLSNLGHELRTQLSSIHGITHLLLHQDKEGLTPTKLSEFSKNLSVCNSQMLFLVDDILDIHSIESKNFKLSKRAENLELILKRVINPLKTEAQNKNLEFECTIDSKLESKFFKVDASRLNQVIQNLVSNAIKYTEKGHVRFLVEVKSQSREHTEILFSIKDSGLGIKQTDMNKVFESFSQIRDQTTMNIGGTGLGLSIAKTIIQKMDSQIHLDSTPKEGSNFYFHLHLENSFGEGSTNENNLNSGGCRIEFLKGKKILITEDNKISMLYASKLLQDNGAIVLKAYNGLEAVKMVKDHQDISVILLDLEMPVMNGFVAIKRIKQYNNAIKIIAFTANIPENKLKRKLRDLKFDGFLAKPYKNQDMFSILNEHLDL